MLLASFLIVVVLIVLYAVFVVATGVRMTAEFDAKYATPNKPLPSSPSPTGSAEPTVSSLLAVLPSTSSSSPLLAAESKTYIAQIQHPLGSTNLTGYLVFYPQDTSNPVRVDSRPRSPDSYRWFVTLLQSSNPSDPSFFVLRPVAAPNMALGINPALPTTPTLVLYDTTHKQPAQLWFLQPFTARGRVIATNNAICSALASDLRIHVDDRLGTLSLQRGVWTFGMFPFYILPESGICARGIGDCSSTGGQCPSSSASSATVVQPCNCGAGAAVEQKQPSPQFKIASVEDPTLGLQCHYDPTTGNTATLQPLASATTFTMERMLHETLGPVVLLRDVATAKYLGIYSFARGASVLLYNPKDTNAVYWYLRDGQLIAAPATEANGTWALSYALRGAQIGAPVLMFQADTRNGSTWLLRGENAAAAVPPRRVCQCAGNASASSPSAPCACVNGYTAVLGGTQCIASSVS